MKRANDLGVVSLCLPCHDASVDLQHDLLGQYVTSRDFDLDVSLHCPALMLSALSFAALCGTIFIVKPRLNWIELKICDFQMSNKKLYDSKVTRRH